MPRKLIESTFITLDGVISNPHHYGGPYWDDEHNAYGVKLMGRRCASARPRDLQGLCAGLAGALG